ncbi:unnamed protein product, partial [Laminaria digitata]
MYQVECCIFVRECIASELERSKAGCEQVPLFRHAFARVYPVAFTKFGMFPFLSPLFPFLTCCGWMFPGLAHKHLRRVTFLARGCCGSPKRPCRTSKIPAAQTRSNVIQ